jgi:hypothetical protein
MYKRLSPIIVLTLLLGSQSIFADVAPPEGYVKVSRSIVIRTDDDLSAYRFLLVSGNLVREVVPIKGDKVVVSGLGGGARYSGGTLYAVPRGSVTSFPTTPSSDQSQDMADRLIGAKVPGAVELLREGFSAEVRKEEAATISDAEYRISKTANGVTAEKTDAQRPLNSAPSPSTVMPVSSDVVPPVAAGLLLSAFVVGGGLWLRRSNSKRKDA